MFNFRNMPLTCILQKYSVHSLAYQPGKTALSGKGTFEGVETSRDLYPRSTYL